MAQRLTPAQIAARARAYGLDPRAVLQVAGAEGLSGGIGDGGHAYGPFQLNNAGGVITGSHPGVNDPSTQAWAWSPQGVDYALSRISKVARGQRGARAVRSIVTQFERPADPSGEIARALGTGGAGAGASFSPAPAASPMPAAQVAPPQPDPRQLLTALQGASSGGDYTGFYRQLGQQRQQPQPRVPGVSASLAPGGPPGVAPGGGVGGIAKTALTQLGTPYQWGGKAALGSRTDCSGLLQASARANGIQLGRTTYQQYRQGSPVALNQLQPGDAVFSEPTAQGPGHVAIYIGGGRVVEDPHTGASVRISTLAGRRGIVGARRYG